MKTFELIRCRNLYKMCQYLPLRSNVISLGTILPVKVFSSLKDLCTTKSSKLFGECFQTLQQYPSQYGLQLLNPFSTNRTVFASFETVFGRVKSTLSIIFWSLLCASGCLFFRPFIWFHSVISLSKPGIDFWTIVVFFWIFQKSANTPTSTR